MDSKPDSYQSPDTLGSICSKLKDWNHNGGRLKPPLGRGFTHLRGNHIYLFNASTAIVDNRLAHLLCTQILHHSANQWDENTLLSCTPMNQCKTKLPKHSLRWRTRIVFFENHKHQPSQLKHLFHQLRNPTVQNPIMQHYQLINTSENYAPSRERRPYTQE